MSTIHIPVFIYHDVCLVRSRLEQYSKGEVDWRLYDLDFLARKLELAENTMRGNLDGKNH